MPQFLKNWNICITA